MSDQSFLTLPLRHHRPRRDDRQPRRRHEVKESKIEVDIKRIQRNMTEDAEPVKITFRDVHHKDLPLKLQATITQWNKQTYPQECDDEETGIAGVGIPGVEEIHNHFHGRDYSRKGIHRGIHIHGPRPAYIIVDNDTGNAAGQINLGQNQTNRVLVEYNRGTQTPSVNITLRRQNRQRVSIRIGGPSLVTRDPDGAGIMGIEYIRPGQIEDRLILTQYRNIRANLHCIAMEVMSRLDPDFTSADEEDLPKIMGISPEPLDQLKADYHRTEAQLDPVDRLIARLALGEYMEMFILQAFKEHENEPFAFAFQHFQAVMLQTCYEGEAWIFKTAGRDISDQAGAELQKFYGKKEMDPWAAPTWLGSKFTFEAWISKNTVEFTTSKTVEWSTFIKPSPGVSSEAQRKLMQAALLRDWEFVQNIFLQSFCGTVNHSVHMYQHPVEKKNFRIMLGVVDNSAGHSAGHNLPKVVPPPGTLLELFVKHPDLMTNVKFFGAVVDDHWATGADCVITARIEFDRPDMFADFKGETTDIKIKSSHASFINELNSIRLVSEGFSRQVGVDIPSLVLGAAPQIPPNRQNNALGITQQQVDVAKNMLINDAHRTISVTQGRILDSVANRAITVVQGMGGTGKTESLAMALYVWLYAGKKCLVSAQTNAAVEELIDRFLKFATQLGKIPQLVLVRSDRQKKKAKQGGTDDGFSWDFVTEGRTRAHDQFESYTYEVKLDRFIRDIANDESNALYTRAKAYNDARVAIKDAFKTGQPLVNMSELRTAMNDNLPFLEPAFVKTIGLVFATFGCCKHEALVDDFQPQCALIDEASQSSPSAIARPLGTFGKSIVSLLLGGDAKQLTPACFSDRVNECAFVIKQSILAIMESEKTRFEEEFGVQFFQLNVQYRMRSEISQWPMNEFYENMSNGPNVDRETRISLFLQDFFKQNIKPGNLPGNAREGPRNRSFGGRTRIAFNVSGPRSQAYGKTNSQYQENEAYAALVIILKLLKHECKVPGAVQHLKPSDIGFLTFYAGQKVFSNIVMRNTWLESNRQNLTLEDARLVEKWPYGYNSRTVAEFQGHERPVMILSMVANHGRSERGTGFVGQAENLAFGTTRACEALIILGNFDAWLQVCDRLERRSESKSLASLTRDLEAKRDLYPLDSIVSDAEMAAYKLLDPSNPQHPGLGPVAPPRVAAPLGSEPARAAVNQRCVGLTRPAAYDGDRPNTSIKRRRIAPSSGKKADTTAMETDGNDN